MLRPEGLHFSLFDVACLGAVNLITITAIQPLWGVVIDRFGTKRAMTFGGFGIALVPVLFLLSNNFWFWLAVNIYDGIVWSAWGLACGMYMFDIVTPPKRARCTAFSSILVTSIGMIGTFAGAACANYIPQVWPLPWTVFGLNVTHPFGILLIISAVLRFLPNLLLLPTFREARVFTKPPEPVLVGAA
jgi:MFS family permease